MKLIHSNYEILEQGNGLDGINEQIELAGRTCYKSEDKITEDSAKDFVDRMINSGHMAMLEHGTVYLKQDCDGILNQINPIWEKYEKNKHSKVIYYSELCDTHIKSDLLSNTAYITTNYRVLVENNWLDDLQYLCEPTEYHEKRITVKFTCDRGVSHEFVRHRVFSFAQESTRYCNYSKDKFGNEITYICPCWLDYDKVQELTEIANRDNKEVYKMGHDESLSMEERGLCSFVYDMSNHEHGYLFQISAGWKPQDARAILPNCLKTELVMTGFASDWKGFFKLRDNSKAHPDAQALAKPLHEEFIKKGYIDGNLD